MNASVVETHSSTLFFVDDRVYKRNRPLDLCFSDFRTREARLACCRDEVRLNRRLAPDVYLGVADIIGTDGQLCDHLVVMRRMPDDRLLASSPSGGSPAAGRCSALRQPHGPSSTGTRMLPTISHPRRWKTSTSPTAPTCAARCPASAPGRTRSPTASPAPASWPSLRSRISSVGASGSSWSADYPGPARPRSPRLSRLGPAGLTSPPT